MSARQNKHEAIARSRSRLRTEPHSEPRPLGSVSWVGRTSLLLLAVASASAQIPVGLDAYRLWDRWPYQRIGVRAYMRSTYDRAGGNERADASHFLYQLGEDRNVTLDVEGPGQLYFVR